MNVFSTCLVLMRVPVNERHVIFKRNSWKIREDIVIDVCIFMSSYLECTLRQCVAEKEFDIVIQMTLEHVLV